MGADIEELMVMEAVRRSLAESQEAAERHAQERDDVSLAQRRAAAERAAAAEAVALERVKSNDGNSEALSSPLPSSLAKTENSAESNEKAHPAPSPNAVASSSSSMSNPSSSSPSSPAESRPNSNIVSSPTASPTSNTSHPPSTAPIETASVTASAISPPPPRALFEPTSSIPIDPRPLSPPSLMQPLASDHSSEETPDHSSYSQRSHTSLEDAIEPDASSSIHRNILLPSGASMLSHTEPYGDAASMRTGHVTAFSLYSGETGDETWTMTSPPSIISQQPPTSLAPGRPSMSINMDLDRDSISSTSSTKALKSLKSEYSYHGSVTD